MDEHCLSAFMVFDWLTASSFANQKPGLIAHVALDKDKQGATVDYESDMI